MARRREFQGVCNSFLGFFVSRNKDLDGYWALGQYQYSVRKSASRSLWFDFCAPFDISDTSRFARAQRAYQLVFKSQLVARKTPADWCARGGVAVTSVSVRELLCVVRVTDDLGRTYRMASREFVLPHDPYNELRRCASGRNDWWPHRDAALDEHRDPPGYRPSAPQGGANGYMRLRGWSSLTGLVRK
ncbi:MAG: hypothetical protein MK208_01010 [Shimia sp.]|uniref:hypothetical protein n=1 Tax=Shimia sp. TaxID=1954381 RepID=UPI0025D3E695|nr:hypothetical protein [Shimia sp.]MCH2065786.1 hypothetical protein [Shimia sp.]